MPKSMTMEEFLNACEDRLRRAEGFVKNPVQLQSDLNQLEEVLRSEWPDAILELKDTGLTTQEREKLEMIVEKIKKLEIIAKSRLELFDGIEEFLQKTKSS